MNARLHGGVLYKAHDFGTADVNGGFDCCELRSVDLSEETFRRSLKILLM